MPDLTVGGLRIHYAAAPPAPRRPAVVFLHGAGANHTVWLGQMRDLRDRAWVVLPDLPSHGRSGSVPGVTIDEYAGALAPFLEDVRDRLPAGAGGGLVLAGHSMGGAIALAVALAHPTLLSGMVLVGSGAKMGVSARILEGLETAPQETQALIARWSFTERADPALILRTMRDLSGSPPERTLADFRACNTFDVRDRIAEISLPVLLICGSEDAMTPPRYSTFMAERMPRATLRLIEGMGHAVMIEASEAVSGSIASFLETI